MASSSSSSTPASESTPASPSTSPSASPATPSASASTSTSLAPSKLPTTPAPTDSPSADDAESEEAAPLTPEQEFTLHHHSARNEKPTLTIDRYLARHLLPPEQLAGFRRYALDHHPGMFTVAEWDVHYEAFKNSPVR